MALNTDKAPSVTNALKTRITVRGFLDTPIPEDVLTRILTTALRSPSGGNLQPWKAHVMTGKTLERFTSLAAEMTLSGKMEAPTHPPYPSPLWEPQRSWRYKLGEDMYALLGIEKDNKMGRMVQLAENAKFFGAPLGIIVTGNVKLEVPQYYDIGIWLQSIMLLAREAGLHTAPQGWWRSFNGLSHDILDIDEGEEVLVGLAMGYGDAEASVNDLYADRAELPEVTKFYK